MFFHLLWALPLRLGDQRENVQDSQGRKGGEQEVCPGGADGILFRAGVEKACHGLREVGTAESRNLGPTPLAVSVQSLFLTWRFVA